MTEEQFQELELFIKALISEADRASGNYEALRLHETRKCFRLALGLPEYEDKK